METLSHRLFLESEVHALLTHGIPVIDADGHVMELDNELFEFLPEPYRHMVRSETYGFFPSLDGWHRGFDVAGKDRTTPPPGWVAFLDEMGIDQSVLYPTAGLGIGLIQDSRWASAVAHAYNGWMAERYCQYSNRLHGVALLAPQDPAAAAVELRRSVTQLGLTAGMLPAATALPTYYGDSLFDPIYQEAQALNVPLTIHGAPSRGMGFDFFRKFVEVHTLEHPFAIFIQFTHMVFEGVFERFPDLDVAYLEAGSTWLPYMMDRMDEEFEKPYGPQSGLHVKPSEIIAGGHIWATCEVEEQSLPEVIRRMGATQLMWPSDYPHERLRNQFRGDLPGFLGRGDLTESVKAAILAENANRFYRLG